MYFLVFKVKQFANVVPCSVLCKYSVLHAYNNSILRNLVSRLLMKNLIHLTDHSVKLRKAY
jgi:hypothetical protein